jgi:hypothetical protein
MTYLGAVIPSVLLWQIVVVMNCFGTTICSLLTEFGPTVCGGLSVLRIDAIRAMTALSLGVVEIYRYSTISNFSQGIVWLIVSMTLLLVVHIREMHQQEPLLSRNHLTESAQNKSLQRIVL